MEDASKETSGKVTWHKSKYNVAIFGPPLMNSTADVNIVEYIFLKGIRGNETEEVIVCS